MPVGTGHYACFARTFLWPGFHLDDNLVIAQDELLLALVHAPWKPNVTSREM